MRDIREAMEADEVPPEDDEFVYVRAVYAIPKGELTEGRRLDEDVTMLRAQGLEPELWVFPDEFIAFADSQRSDAETFRVHSDTLAGALAGASLQATENQLGGLPETGESDPDGER